MHTYKQFDIGLSVILVRITDDFELVVLTGQCLETMLMYLTAAHEHRFQ